MALTKAQENAIIRLWVKSFAGCNNPADRKKLYVEFVDEFGKGILEWEKKIKNMFSDLDISKPILEEFDKYVLDAGSGKIQCNIQCNIRLLEENDFQQVKEILKSELNVFMFDKSTMKKFVDSGYSYVAYEDDQILGVVLADSVCKIYCDDIWIEVLAVASNFQGNGIGKKLFNQICKKAVKDKKYNIKLYTERNRDAYQIYRHWGMKETNGVHMEMFCS